MISEQGNHCVIFWHKIQRLVAYQLLYIVEKPLISSKISVATPSLPLPPLSLPSALPPLPSPFPPLFLLCSFPHSLLCFFVCSLSISLLFPLSLPLIQLGSLGRAVSSPAWSKLQRVLAYFEARKDVWWQRFLLFLRGAKCCNWSKSVRYLTIVSKFAAH